jgi:hypothetical protein
MVYFWVVLQWRPVAAPVVLTKFSTVFSQQKYGIPAFAGMMFLKLLTSTLLSRSALE